MTTPFQLAEEDRRFFDENGYIKLRGVLDRAQLEHFGPLITEQVIALNTQDLPLEERDTYGKAFLQIENLWRHDEAVSRFVHSPDLARLAAGLLGVRAVRLYHDQALYKEPSGGITPWHADQYYWPMDSDRCCTVWIPLQDTGPEMGPLTFYAGSHTFSEGRDLPISDDSERRIAELMTEQGFSRDDNPYQLGDISFHLGWTFHGAGANQGQEPRRVMTIIYMDADMVIKEPTNDNQQADLENWLVDSQPGDTVGGPFNPLLYESSGTA
ncbi:phytanoyl-CoA dioxygenase family protein [Brachybacterium sp. AOP43-C2-M15]|uniref:phytanoyl-CoA dioxygenase family protein n=1 Tax=Brachybacterium sp. AOP43-C2-M15 TaxID=3457661 RepID=UPI004033BD99